MRHVNIGHDLVRPTAECLTGNRMISSYFKSNPSGVSTRRDFADSFGGRVTLLSMPGAS